MRSYDLLLGSFMSRDPIGIAGGDTNFYRYVQDDPLRLTDPTGLNSNGYSCGAGPWDVLTGGVSTDNTGGVIGTMIGGVIGAGVGGTIGAFVFGTIGGKLGSSLDSDGRIPGDNVELGQRSGYEYSGAPPPINFGKIIDPNAGHTVIGPMVPGLPKVRLP